MEIVNGCVLSGEFSDELKNFSLKWIDHPPLNEKWKNNWSNK